MNRVMHFQLRHDKCNATKLLSFDSIIELDILTHCFISVCVISFYFVLKKERSLFCSEKILLSLS